MNLEPAITDAATFSPQSGTITVNQVVSAEISITPTATVNMSPAISGISGGTGDGSTAMTVITNNTNGFSLAVKAGSSPAMRLNGTSTTVNFADYTWTSPTPDYTWSVAAAASEFGFTVEAGTAADTVQAFKSQTNVCNSAAGTRTADTCWAPFSTTNYTVINRSSPTSVTGEAETIKFRAQSGASHYQQQGTYTATITVTATTN